MRKYGCCFLVVIMLMSLLSSCSYLPFLKEKKTKTELPILTAEELKSEAEGAYGDDWAAEIEAADEGDIITFGFYEQDNDLENGREPIEWIILKKEGTCCTLISHYLLDSIDYDELCMSDHWMQEFSWETCCMRQWLHEVFLANSFTADALSYIKAVPFSYTLAEGEAPVETVDSAYLLTPEEALLYFPEQEYEYRCQPTPYFIEQYGDLSDWALRGSSGGQNDEYLLSEGTYSNSYYFYLGIVDDAFSSGFYGAVRPVVTIDISEESVAAQKSKINKYGETLYKEFRCNGYADLLPEEYDQEYAMYVRYGEEAYRQFRSDGYERRREDLDLIHKYGDEWNEICLNAKEGESITFGTYEQDNDLSNGAEPIVWDVLKRTEGEIWLASHSILDAAPYDSIKTVEWDPVEGLLDTEVAWNDTDLCHWLNEEFASAAFTDQQMEMLKDSNSMLTQEYGRVQVYPVSEEREAEKESKIRLLTYDEAAAYYFKGEYIYYNEDEPEWFEEYIVPDEDLRWVPYLWSTPGTIYAYEQAPDSFSEYEFEGIHDGSWWLLTKEHTGEADYVYVMGDIGTMPVDWIMGVRPLICINLEE